MPSRITSRLIARGRSVPLLVSLLAGTLVIVVVGALDCTEIRRYKQEVRADTLQSLSTLRANAESSINKRVYLTLGLKAHVANNPDITREEFEDFAASLMYEGQGIRSVTLIRNNIITEIYPREGNEIAVGLRLLDHPEQRNDVIRAMQSREAYLAGPIELVQGGEAFVNRAPVFEKAPGEAPGTGPYWGLVSLLLDKETLIREILRDVPDDLQIAIATVIPGDDGRPEELKMFVGSKSIEAADPLRLEITLPSGHWQVLGVPAGGWPTHAPVSPLFRIGGLIFAGIVAILVFAVLHANFRYHAAQEAAVAASTAKSEFLANMSHEIRTPMTAILGFADELDDIEAEEHAREAVQAIRRNGAHLLELINDILDVSKIEAGKLAVERIACSPVTILSEVAELTRPRAEAKGLKFGVRFEGLIPDVVQTDPLRLRQILFNLIANGIKFTECGTVTISLRLDEADTAAPHLSFTIADTGVGISDEQLPQLFQPFTQADASTSRRFGGTGLGLAISRRLTEMLGGTLSVTSKLGEGTRFVLRIPTGSLQRAHFVRPDARSLLAITRGTDYQVADRKPREALELNRRPLEGIRLLLAEDGPDNRRLLAYMLGKAGAAMEFAEDGRQAIELVTQHGMTLRGQSRFDLVLMDMQMPEVDGYAATRELRKKGYTLPIIALTAHAMRDDERKCLEAGCTAYTTKPIDRRQLIELILHCLTPANHAPTELVH